MVCHQDAEAIIQDFNPTPLRLLGYGMVSSFTLVYFFIDFSSLEIHLSLMFSILWGWQEDGSQDWDPWPSRIMVEPSTIGSSLPLLHVKSLLTTFSQLVSFLIQYQWISKLYIPFKLFVKCPLWYLCDQIHQIIFFLHL